MIDFDDYDDEDERLILSFENGKGKIIKESDYNNTIQKQQELMAEFIEQNTELFIKFLDNKGISEAEFNGEQEQDQDGQN
jgi:hypothetical protein